MKKQLLLAMAITAAATGCTTTSSSSPGDASAKRSASPHPEGRIVAAKAFGEQWTLDVKPGPKLDRPTTFQWGTNTPATGTLTEDAAAGEVLRLKGKLTTAEGERPATITFVPEDCVDDGGNHHEHLVRVEIAGIDVETGCGDLAK